MKDLIHTSQLKSVLGYADMRSVNSWLRKKKAPLVVLGRNTYIPVQFINELIKSTLGAEYASQEPSVHSRKSITTHVVMPLENKKTDPRHTRIKRPKNNYSTASARLLKNIKLG